MVVRFPRTSQKCGGCLSEFAVFLWHSTGCSQGECPPGHNSNRPLLLMSVLCHLAHDLFAHFQGMARLLSRQTWNTPPPPQKAIVVGEVVR